MGAPPVLTIQVGTYANHVGAHYWNLGDEALGRGSGPGSGLAPDGSPVWRVSPAAGGALRADGTVRPWSPTAAAEAEAAAKAAAAAAAAASTAATAASATTPAAGAVPNGAAAAGMAAARLPDAGVAATAAAAEAAIGATLHRLPPGTSTADGGVGGWPPPDGVAWAGRTVRYAAPPIHPSPYAAALGLLDADLEATADRGWCAPAPSPPPRGANEARTPPMEEDADVVAARQLEDPAAVRYWSDYLKAPLWRHSLLTYGGTNADAAPTSLAAGMNVAAGPATAGDGGDGGGGLLAAAVERVRRLAEEADRLGGIQLLAESRSGMAAVAAGLLSALRDELLSPSTPVLVVGAAPFVDAAAAAVTPSTHDPPSAVSVAAAAVAADACEGWLLAAAAGAGATYVPLTTRGWAGAATRRPRGGGWSVTGPGGAWRVDPSAAYHSAAILATALEVATATPGRRGGVVGPGSAGDLASLGDLTTTLRPAPWAMLSRPRVCLPLARAPGLRLSTQLSAGLGRLATSSVMVPLSSAPRRSRTVGSGRVRRITRRRYGEGFDSSDEEEAEAAATAGGARRHGGGRRPSAGTTATAAGVSVAAQAVCLRGVGLGPFPPDGAPTTAAAAALADHTAATESAAAAAGRTGLAVAAAPVPLPVPYPRLFGCMFGPRGEALAVPRRADGAGEWGVELTETAVLTAVTTEGGGWSVATADGTAAALRRGGGDGADEAAEALTGLADDYYATL
ncbi:hypothetical protein MMPV_005973 [Pyropia vietnamensis]